MFVSYLFATSLDKGVTLDVVYSLSLGPPQAAGIHPVDGNTRVQGGGE